MCRISTRVNETDTKGGCRQIYKAYLMEQRIHEPRFGCSVEAASLTAMLTDSLIDSLKQTAITPCLAGPSPF